MLDTDPYKNPHIKIIVPEKRNGQKDRRKLSTYIADDRRRGSADRRNREGFLSPMWQVIVTDSI